MVNTHILASITGNLLLFMLVYGMSATVDIRSLIAQMHNKKALITGMLLQFAVLPFLGFVAVNIINVGDSMGITLLVITSSPGGSFSNWWCSMFNADLALSVTMTAISTLLSVVMLPLNLLIYAKYTFNANVLASLDWTSLFTALLIVICAISLGLITSARIHSHRFNLFANGLGNLAGVLLIIFSSLMSNTSKNARLWQRPWTFYVAVASPCVLALIIANVITTFCKLNKPERVTVSIECCYQNVGIATSVALTMFNGNNLAEAMGVPLFYGIVEAVVLGIYCVVVWKLGWTKAPPDVNFCTMISTSYEVLVAEKEEEEAIEISLAETEKGLQETEKSASGELKFHYQFFPFCCELPERKEPSGASERLLNSL